MKILLILLFTINVSFAQSTNDSSNSNDASDINKFLSGMMGTQSTDATPTSERVSTTAGDDLFNEDNSITHTLEGEFVIDNLDLDLDDGQTTIVIKDAHVVIEADISFTDAQVDSMAEHMHTILQDSPFFGENGELLMSEMSRFIDVLDVSMVTLGENFNNFNINFGDLNDLLEAELPKIADAIAEMPAIFNRLLTNENIALLAGLTSAASRAGSLIVDQIFNYLGTVVSNIWSWINMEEEAKVIQIGFDDAKENWDETQKGLLAMQKMIDQQVNSHEMVLSLISQTNKSTLSTLKRRYINWKHANNRPLEISHRDFLLLKKVANSITGEVFKKSNIKDSVDTEIEDINDELEAIKTDKDPLLKEMIALSKKIKCEKALCSEISKSERKILLKNTDFRILLDKKKKKNKLNQSMVKRNNYVESLIRTSKNLGDSSLDLYSQKTYCSSLGKNLDNFAKRELVLQTYRFQLIVGRPFWERHLKEYFERLEVIIDSSKADSLQEVAYEEAHEMAWDRFAYKNQERISYQDDWFKQCTSDEYVRLDESGFDGPLRSTAQKNCQIRRHKLKLGERDKFLRMAHKDALNAKLTAAQNWKIKMGKLVLRWNSGPEDDALAAYDNWFNDLYDQQYCYGRNKTIPKCQQMAKYKFVGNFDKYEKAKERYESQCLFVPGYRVNYLTANNLIAKRIKVRAFQKINYALDSNNYDVRGLIKIHSILNQTVRNMIKTDVLKDVERYTKRFGTYREKKSNLRVGYSIFKLQYGYWEELWKRKAKAFEKIKMMNDKCQMNRGVFEGNRDICIELYKVNSLNPKVIKGREEKAILIKSQLKKWKKQLYKDCYIDVDKGWSFYNKNYEACSEAYDDHIDHLEDYK